MLLLYYESIVAPTASAMPELCPTAVREILAKAFLGETKQLDELAGVRRCG